MKSKKIQSIIGVLISGGLITWMALEINWHKVLEDIARARYVFLIHCTVVFLLNMWVRSVRWKVLLPHVEGEPRPRLFVLFDSFMIGNLATFILPLRAGEFIRPYVLSLKSSVPFASGFVSVVIERFFDLAAVLVSFGVMLQYIPGVPPQIIKGALALSVMAGCILIALMVSAYAPHFVNRVSSIGASVLPKKLGAVLLSFASKFVEGARVLRSPVRLASVVGLTVVAWLSNYVLFYEYVVLMNNTTPTPLLAVAIAVVLALAVALPSMPGFIGVYQAGCVCAFALFGISEEVAVSFAIVTHVYQYAVLVLYGLISFLMGSFKLSYLRQQG